MLPTPAIFFWSSRNALIGARDRRASAWRCSAVNSSASGSTPSRASKNAAHAPGPGARPGAEPRVEERGQRLGAERELAGAEAARVVEHERVLAEPEAHARVT